MKRLLAIPLIMGLFTLIALAQDTTPLPPMLQCTDECPIIVEPTLHEVHFARHKSEVRTLGENYCKTCHGSDLNGTESSMAHGVRVFLSKETFNGPIRCYTSPYRAPGSPPVDDPYGRFAYADQVCTGTPETKNLAVFTEGDFIGCNNCHN
jgi:hypothetical protein